jgi:hypothetical protein
MENCHQTEKVKSLQTERNRWKTAMEMHLPSWDLGWCWTHQIDSTLRQDHVSQEA